MPEHGFNSVLDYFSDFTPEQVAQFQSLGDLYREWNEKINVISRKDTEHFYTHHVLHSLAIATQFEFGAGLEIMDLGCGGGFPGVPLAIFFPEAQFLLVDSINKKLKVVQEICAAAGIRNVQTRHARAEEIKDRKFDIVVSRAVAPLGDLWKWSRPLLRPASHPGNGLICLKGGDLSEETSASNCKPKAWEIAALYNDPYFAEKYILQVPYRK